MKRREFAFVALVAALTLPAMLALFRAPGYWESHDGLFHLYRLLALENAWRQGYFYPRIFPEFAFGYGFPVLNFYGPLTYYVALFNRFLGAPPILAMKATYALSYPLAALGMWKLAREVWGKGTRPNEWAGIIAAAVYTFVPYHLADVQLRGALAESWAFVWWGWLLWAACRGRHLTFMFTLAALVLTHNLSVVLIAFPLAAWCLIALARAHDRRRTFLALAAATLGAAALTAFYWVPVLLESRYVMISQDVGGLGFARHLQPLREWVAASANYRFFPDQGTAGEHPLSWAQVAILAVAFIASLPAVRHHKAVWLFGWTLLFLSLFLLSPFSFPLWERLNFPFGLIQYPWRWLGMTALASALVAGGAAVGLPKRAAWGVYGTIGLLSVWLAWSGLANLPYREREVDVARYPVNMWEEDAANGQVGATWTAEFLPLSVKEQRWALTRAPEEVAGLGARTPVRIRSFQSDGFDFSVELESAEAAVITFPRFYYPSMAGFESGSKTELLPLSARGELGLASVEAMAGRSRLIFNGYPLASRGLFPDFLEWAGYMGVVAALVYVGTRRRNSVITDRTGPQGLRPGWRGTVGIVLALLFFLSPALWRLANPPLLYNGIEPVTVGEQAQLVAWKAPTGRAGQPLPITLLWFNLEQTDQNYVTFIHVTPPGGGAPVAQHDGQPNMGTVPTTRWLPGQLVEDLHLVELPSDLLPGRYEVWAGMYALRDGQAVPLEGDSGERRLLGEIAIQ